MGEGANKHGRGGRPVDKPDTCGFAQPLARSHIDPGEDVMTNRQQHGPADSVPLGVVSPNPRQPIKQDGEATLWFRQLPHRALNEQRETKRNGGRPRGAPQQQIVGHSDWSIVARVVRCFRQPTVVQSEPASRSIGVHIIAGQDQDPGAQNVQPAVPNTLLG
jgi:hypothetical protein